MVIPAEPSNSIEDDSGSDDAGVSVRTLPKDATAPPPEQLTPEFLKGKKQYWKERIGSIKYVVAPMVDQSELAFRMMMRDHGAQLAYTPMIHAALFIADPTYRRKTFSTCARDRPLIVQFCANDPPTLITACRLVEGHCDGVDLNLGCPQVIARKGHYGAYLQESPELISNMIRGVFEECKLPISVKIRILGSVEETIDYAKMIERAGASMLTVHGRTREQKGMATGMADWEVISKVKRALSIPVIANGNIQRSGDVERCLEATKADAVMSAEGLLSNPMLFERLHLPSYTVAREYLQYAETYKASASAIRAHLFRICNYSLLKHPDLREKNSYVCRVVQFREVVDEIERREMEAENCLANSKLEEVRTSTDSNTPLEELVNSLPDWVCKPYVRPPAKPLDQETKNAIGGEYRQQRRAKIEELAAELSLSKKQVRKREHRRIEMQRKMCKRPEYPKCASCQQPGGIDCQNKSCRKCCRLICIRGPYDCKAHRFDSESMSDKRNEYARKMGISLEQLLTPKGEQTQE